MVFISCSLFLSVSSFLYISYTPFPSCLDLINYAPPLELKKPKASPPQEMGGTDVDDESPLSITASIAGILTFLVAIVGAIWLRINSLRSADTEYERVKTALKWWVVVSFISCWHYSIKQIFGPRACHI